MHYGVGWIQMSWRFNKISNETHYCHVTVHIYLFVCLLVRDTYEKNDNDDRLYFTFKKIFKVVGATSTNMEKREREWGSFLVGIILHVITFGKNYHSNKMQRAWYYFLRFCEWKQCIYVNMGVAVIRLWTGTA